MFRTQLDADGVRHRAGLCTISPVIIRQCALQQTITDVLAIVQQCFRRGRFYHLQHLVIHQARVAGFQDRLAVVAYVTRARAGHTPMPWGEVLICMVIGDGQEWFV